MLDDLSISLKMLFLEAKISINGFNNELSDGSPGPGDKQFYRIDLLYQNQFYRF